MRAIIYYVGIGIAGIGSALLALAEGILWLVIAWTYLVEGNVFALFLWLILGSILLGIAFAVLRLPLYALGLMLVRVSGHSPEAASQQSEREHGYVVTSAELGAYMDRLEAEGVPGRELFTRAGEFARTGVDASVVDDLNSPSGSPDPH